MTRKYKAIVMVEFPVLLEGCDPSDPEGSEKLAMKCAAEMVDRALSAESARRLGIENPTIECADIDQIDCELEQEDLEAPEDLA